MEFQGYFLTGFDPCGTFQEIKTGEKTKVDTLFFQLPPYKVPWMHGFHTTTECGWAALTPSGFW